MYSAYIWNSPVDLNKLKIFYFAAKSASFSNNELHLSPSVVSRHVSDLEHRYKIKLFHRYPRKLVLTTEGHILYKAMHLALDEINRAQVMMLGHKNQEQEVLKLDFYSPWIADIITPHVIEFIKKYPQIRVMINNKAVLPNHGLQDQDFNITILPHRFHNSNAHVEKLVTLRFGLFASQLYKKQFGMPTTVNELDNHRLLAYNSIDVNDPVNWHLTAGRITSEQRQSYFSLDSLQYVTEQGLGIAPLLIQKDNLMITNNFVRVLQDIEPKIIKLYWVCPQHKQDVKTHKLFQDYMVETLKKT